MVEKITGNGYEELKKSYDEGNLKDNTSIISNIGELMFESNELYAVDHGTEERIKVPKSGLEKIGLWTGIDSRETSRV